jgi:hypothetical protein
VLKADLRLEHFCYPVSDLFNKKNFIGYSFRKPRHPVQWAWSWFLTPGVKRPVREANHSPSSSAEIKNG